MLKGEEEIEVEVKRIRAFIEEKENEAERYKLALFLVVRNSQVMDYGLSQEMSMTEINELAYKTMLSLMEMIDYDITREMYEEAEGCRPEKEDGTK